MSDTFRVLLAGLLHPNADLIYKYIIPVSYDNILVKYFNDYHVIIIITSSINYQLFMFMLT
jgi:hypothetical protein